MSVPVRENGGKDRGTRTFSLFTPAGSRTARSPSVGRLGRWGTYKRAVRTAARPNMGSVGRQTGAADGGTDGRTAIAFERFAHTLFLRRF